MTRRLDTVSTEKSGADSVPPSLAGWEETKVNLKRGSSHHEAHRSSYGLAGRARPFGRRLGKDVGLNMRDGSIPSMEGRGECDD